MSEIEASRAARKPRQRRSEAEVAALRAARAERKTQNDDAEGRAAADEDNFEPDLFLNEDYAARSFELGDGAQACLCLESASTDHDLTGQVVWPVSVVLARFVNSQGAALAGKRVVELGAGTGLAGLAAARAGAARVTLTDGSDVVLRLLARSLATPAVARTLRAPAASQKLLWGDRRYFEALGGCDVVLGADVVCWPRAVEPLLQTVRALLRGAADGVFFCGFVSRSQATERLFFATSEKFGFALREHPLAEFLPDPAPEDCRSTLALRVLELRLRDDAETATDVFHSDDPRHADATGDLAC